MKSEFGTTRRRQQAGVAQGLVVILAAFLPILAIVSLAPAVPSVIAAFSHVPGSATLVPLAVTAPGLMIAIFSPLMGWIVDRYGRRKLLIVATVVYGFVGMIPFFVGSLQVLIASRLLLGICEAAILTVTNTLLGDYYAHDKRRLWLTLQGLIGPILGTSVVFASGYLASQSWQLPFIVYAVAFPISVMMLAFIYEPDVNAELATTSLDSVPFPLGRVAICGGFTLFAASLYYVYIVQIGRAFGEVGLDNPGRVGLQIGIASIGVFLGAAIFQWVSGRFSSDRQLLIFLTILGIGLIGIGFSPDERSMTAFAFIQQLGAGILIPTLILWTVSQLPAEHRGRGMGVWSACFFLGQFVSPLLVTGAQAVSGSVQGAFATMGVIALIGALSSQIFSRFIR